MDLDSLIIKVFTEPVKPPKSIIVYFEAPDMTMRDTFQALLTFTVSGMRMLFSRDGKTVNIGELSEQDLGKIQAYVNSIGYKLVISKYTQQEFNDNIFPYFTQFNNMPYDADIKTLEIYQYNITDTINSIEYIISFTKL
jgi:hypothetical protein|tara:strand:+ start:110 stop:526 length:417 start_codon:yes stop_codon:yes gene_type:complete